MSKRKQFNICTLLFLWLAGADPEILAECPTEQRKYTGIGATILFNGILASLSGAYALYTVFKTDEVAILLGLLWGVGIINLDRYIVLTMRKKQGGEWKDNVAPILRVAMTLVLSSVVTLPVILRLYDKEIQADLAAQNQTVSMAADQQLSSSDRYSSINKLLKENNELDKAIKDKEAETAEASKEVSAEAEGTGGSRVPGKGIAYEDKKKRHSTLQNELDKLRTRNLNRIDINTTRIEELQKEKEKERKELVSTHVNADGFLARYIALKRLLKDNPSAKDIYYLLIAALMLLEISPVAAKALSTRSVYDSARDELETIEKEIAKKQAEVTRNVEFRKQEIKEEMDKELLELKRNMAKHLIDAATEAAKHDDWGTEETIKNDLVHRIRLMIDSEFEEVIPKTSNKQTDTESYAWFN